MIGYTDLKKSAKHKMAGNWPQILLTVMLIGIIYVSLSVVSSSSDTLNLGDLLLLLLEGPVLIGFSTFMLQLIKTQKPMSMIFLCPLLILSNGCWQVYGSSCGIFSGCCCLLYREL